MLRELTLKFIAGKLAVGDKTLHLLIDHIVRHADIALLRFLHENLLVDHGLQRLALEGLDLSGVARTFRIELLEGNLGRHGLVQFTGGDHVAVDHGDHAGQRSGVNRTDPEQGQSQSQNQRLTERMQGKLLTGGRFADGGRPRAVPPCRERAETESAIKGIASSQND